MRTDTNRVDQMVAEIQQDIVDGRVPADVDTFARLHDYVDANEYGGFCDDDPDDPEWDTLVDQANRCQSFVDAWLRAGRPALARTLPTGEVAHIQPIDGTRGVQVVYWGSAEDYDADATEDTYYDRATVSVAVTNLDEALVEITA